MVAREQLTRGLVFQLNYTWSKCLCDADLTNNFKGDVNYDLPFGHNRSFGKNANEVVDAVL